MPISHQTFFGVSIAIGHQKTALCCRSRCVQIVLPLFSQLGTMLCSDMRSIAFCIFEPSVYAFDGSDLILTMNGFQSIIVEM